MMPLGPKFVQKGWSVDSTLWDTGIESLVLAFTLITHVKFKGRLAFWTIKKI